jgi:hypothetical protein
LSSDSSLESAVGVVKSSSSDVVKRTSFVDKLGMQLSAILKYKKKQRVDTVT